MIPYYPIQARYNSQALLHSIDTPTQNEILPSLSKGATASMRMPSSLLFASSASDTIAHYTDKDRVTSSSHFRAKMDLITSEVANGFSSRASKASLTMKWDLLAFMDTQYVDNKDAQLGSVITLSGTAQYAQATTCSEYAEHNWPSRGSRVIKAFQSAINVRNCTSQGW